MDVDVNDDHVNDSKFALQAPFVCVVVWRICMKCAFFISRSKQRNFALSLFLYLTSERDTCDLSVRMDATKQSINQSSIYSFDWYWACNGSKQQKSTGHGIFWLKN